MRLFLSARSLVLAFVGLLLVAAPGAAQTTGGVKGGITTSTISTDPSASGALGSRIDFSAGAFVVLNTASRMTFQFEGLVSRRGAKLDAPVLNFGFGIGDIRLTYIDLSGLVRFNAGISSDNQFYVIAGPTVGILMKGEFIVLGFGADISDVLEDFDLGLAVGAGIETRFLLLEGRYTHGLRNLVIGTQFAGVSVKSRSFSVLAGIRF